MSKLGCGCGATISDVSSPNPQLGLWISDVDWDAIYCILPDLIAGYMSAVAAGKKATAAWLLDHGFKPGYAELKLSPANVVGDIITRQIMARNRDMYECQTCGGLMVEVAKNRFDYYPAQSGKPRGLFEVRGEFSWTWAIGDDPDRDFGSSDRADVLALDTVLARLRSASGNLEMEVHGPGNELLRSVRIIKHGTAFSISAFVTDESGDWRGNLHDADAPTDSVVIDGHVVDGREVFRDFDLATRLLRGFMERGRLDEDLLARFE